MGLTCKVVTPDTTFFDGQADRMIVPAWDGEMGFLANHSPLIARLGYGVLTIFVGSAPTRIAIFGGFVKVSGNEVIVLAGGAEKGADIEKGDALKALEAAKAESLEKRAPRVTELEAAAVQERLVRAEARIAAVTGEPCPVYQV
jgi:F-type H+-transporting ATPase subunit epsilon